MSDSLWPHELQYARIPCPSLSTRVCSMLKLMSIESVMPSNHLILCHSLLLLLSIFLSIRAFSNELTLHIMWLKYWSFSFSISPSSEYLGLISLQSKGLARIFSSTTIQKHQCFSTQPSLWTNSHIVHHLTNLYPRPTVCKASCYALKLNS